MVKIHHEGMKLLMSPCIPILDTVKETLPHIFALNLSDFIMNILR